MKSLVIYKDNWCYWYFDIIIIYKIFYATKLVVLDLSYLSIWKRKICIISNLTSRCTPSFICSFCFVYVLDFSALKVILPSPVVWLFLSSNAYFSVKDRQYFKIFIDLKPIFAVASQCGCVISLVLNFEQIMHLSR
jgi:hypothetical protein